MDDTAPESSDTDPTYQPNLFMILIYIQIVSEWLTTILNFRNIIAFFPPGKNDYDYISSRIFFLSPSTSLTADQTKLFFLPDPSCILDLSIISRLGIIIVSVLQLIVIAIIFGFIFQFKMYAS